jgi:ribonuclease BN (tRNA processing enzyme)
MMEVKILGSRANVKPSAPRHSKHSGVLVDDRILFDVGEEEYLDYDPDVIFITHLHPDHAFFIEKKTRGIDVPVYAPERNEDAGIDVNVIKEPMDFKGYSITPIPTHHSKLVKSQAYLVERDAKRLLYTGDMIWIDKKYRGPLKELGLVITDGSYYRKGGLVRKDKETGRLYGHNGVKDLVRLFREFTDHIVFTHLGSWFYRDIEASKQKIEELGSEDLLVEAAYDGMTLEI